MTRTIAFLFLLLQLKPLVGMAVCLHQAATADAECPMPAPAAPQPGDRQELTSPPPQAQDHACPFADLCAPAAPALTPARAAVRYEGRLVAAPLASIPATHPADPTAPPAPPPNA